MPSRGLMSSIAVAALTVAIVPIATSQAHAQGLFEFLWGGSQEWGGGKQTVSFDQKYTAGQVIVSFGDRRLYLITKAGTATSYPIAVPREQSRWQGTTSVTDKRINPSWRPTPEMLRENPKLPLWVPGGHRMNPLGVRAMYLGSSTYRIHGTDAPWTIGQAVSKGCIRMLNDDVLDLYPKVPVGTKVTVTWQRFNSQAVASGDEPAPYNPMAAAAAEAPTYKAPPRSIRMRTPAANVETVAATSDTGANDMGAPAVDPSADEAALAAAAEKPLEKKPVKKAEAHKKPAPHEDAVAIAERAAAAAAKAAEAARAAAEAAKKAAEDAKKATSAQSAEPGKSAAL
ncbi:L,D-transpeptidase [Hyphomicrobium album]|uniref:L,D-transpeptidase n=1 Tax=Hyphomicrobium album TaxID=2665159 RepID=UPI001E5593D3|nr:L,D-transpeptidase [Hyphomicrobium album]